MWCASGVTFTLRHANLVLRVILIESNLPTVLLEAGARELAAAQIEMNRNFKFYVEAGKPEEVGRGYMDM